MFKKNVKKTMKAFAGSPAYGFRGKPLSPALYNRRAYSSNIVVTRNIPLLKPLILYKYII